MAWVPCPACNGCGERIETFIGYDEKGNTFTYEQAIICANCLGKAGWEE